MSMKYMKIKRIVIPFLTVVLIVGQVTGCAPLNSQETAEINQETPEVVIELVEPNDLEKRIDPDENSEITVEESREKVDGGEIVKFSDGTTEFISDDTVVPEIVDVNTLEEMGLRDPADNPANNNEKKEVYDNPIIQADSETYIEYLGKTMSLKDYYEEIAQVDPESLVRGGNIERLIAYNPDWASEHGYSLDDVQQPEPEKPATTNIEENHITPAPDPSYITPDNGSLPYEPAGKDEGYIGTIESAGGIDWGDVPPELRPTFK